MKRTLGLLAALGTALMLTALPASAITNGAPDGEGHPYVGLMVAFDANGIPLWRCSGTLISPTVFVTAGHCTDSASGAASAQIWFDSGSPTPIPFDTAFGVADPAHPCVGTTGYPCVGDVGGTVHTYPGFDMSTFWLHDVGVVVLDTPVTDRGYGALPAPNALAGMKPNAHTTFTSVGYGLQQSFPAQGMSSLKDVALRTRMVAHPHLIQIDNPSLGPQSIVLSNNANTGGTCFGDSGGPNFIGDSNVIAGVTSFGKNPTCAGQGGVFRLDQPNVLSWIAGFGS